MMKYILKAGLFLLLFSLPEISTLGQKSDYSNITDQEYLYAFTEATRFYLFGNYVQAVTLYKECLKIRPQSSAARYQLSKVYLSAGNISLARENAKIACRLSVDNKWYYQQLGDIFQMEQKYDSALIVYTHILTINPGDPNIMFMLANLDEKLKKFDDALTYLDLIEKQEGISKEVTLLKYRIYENNNQPDLAIRTLKLASGISGDDFSVSGMIAEYYRRHNQIDSASFYYSKIYPEYKSEPVVVFSYADFLLDRGLKDSARNVLVHIISDSSVNLMTKASFFYSVLRDQDQLIKNMPILDSVTETLYSLYKSDVRVLSIYSDVQIRLRNFEKASKALSIVTRQDPSNYAAIEQLVYAFNAMGKTDSVLLYTGKALQQFKERPLLYLFNGSAQYQKGAWENAVNSLKNGLAYAQDSTLKIEFFSLLAECYQNLGRFSESEEAFNNALKLDPDNSGILNNYAYYLSLREKDLKEAEKMSRRTISEEPDNSTYLDTYAWILFKMGKNRKALKYINNAVVKSNGKNEEILKHSAEIHIKLHMYAEAVQYLKEILKSSDPEESIKIQAQISQIENRK
ncbi:MAG TPA: tetratricopeptide repeat protein [Bacteroidales bacterium]|nr:tetratricopeptide repeat protein [Bacteroidales bacterium]